MAKSSGGTRRTSNNKYQMMSDMQAYDALIDRTGELWNSFTEEQKIALFDYTDEDFGDINKALKRGYLPDDDTQDQIRNITKAIEKSTYDKDMVLRRGVQNESSVFGFSVSKASEGQLKSLVGKTFKMKQFGSFGASEGAGMTGHAEIILRAPKGTKMLYTEPFSAFSEANEGWTWNGKTRQTGIGSENEVILQRGTSYKVDKVAVVNGKNRIYATVTSQDKH